MSTTGEHPIDGPGNSAELPETSSPAGSGWVNRVWVVFCGVFYLGLAGLVFYQKQVPMIRELLGID